MKFGDWYVAPDDVGWMIYRLRLVKSGDSEGELRRSHMTYHGTLTHVAAKLVDLGAREAVQVIQDLDELKATILEVLKAGDGLFSD